MTFKELYKRRLVKEEDFEIWVQSWNEGLIAGNVEEVLGLTWDEYFSYINNPQELTIILEK